MNAQHPSDPHWLNERELAAWKAFSAVMIKLPAALDAQLQREAGLNQFEYLVLAGLSESPGRRLRMSTLAVLANGSLSRLSHVVKRLEARGYLRREPCSDDGRYTNAVLTDDGWTKIVATAPGHVTAVRSLVVDALEPEQFDQLLEISLRVLHAMDPDVGCPGSG
ncbi:MarR family transcriptional regulator [Streptomyces lunaelactis]|uniref:MarR family transcriptional regulator n=1 Tax=Streptomyces lunaelactis TaxID=1535768 RepID=A0A2R4T4X2_9ACTN|nr:MarR family transcriptional regulator [Streptomyces lunaelactis]AVZ74199.1 MarR family transcriptional regulator [Streptomyces lunaelactis]NUK87107.1 MarR family transcriptional regulator [Streptomyces lunaelactis]NUL05041.1 MarR family transcriptional regulator [Streptomyces lunaelactis]